MTETGTGTVPLMVAICCHNPHAGRLAEVLASLANQTLPQDQWLCLLIDNGSTPPLSAGTLPAARPRALGILHEPRLGLTQARRRALREARAEWVVFVDDDNVLAPDFLELALQLAERHPEVAAFGGKVLPRFDQEPPAWTREFHGLLALRNLGDKAILSPNLSETQGRLREYPAYAPIGAGMVLRRDALQAWLDLPDSELPSDRRGQSLSSAGDCDIVIALLKAGWRVAYLPELRLVHLIPTTRLEAAYLARLNRGIQESWLSLLCRHGLSPWPELSPLQSRLRKWKAWFTYRPWTGAAARIRYEGACGHFDGRVTRSAKGKAAP